jgi:hypothetical protein
MMACVAGAHVFGDTRVSRGRVRVRCWCFQQDHPNVRVLTHSLAGRAGPERG